MRYPLPTTTTDTPHAVVPLRAPINDLWRQEARTTIKTACRQWKYFTVDDLYELMEAKGYARGNFGPHLRVYRDKGWMTATSTYIDVGDGPKMVWASNVYEQAAS